MLSFPHYRMNLVRYMLKKKAKEEHNQKVKQVIRISIKQGLKAEKQFTDLVRLDGAFEYCQSNQTI